MLILSCLSPLALPDVTNNFSTFRSPAETGGKDRGSRGVVTGDNSPETAGQPGSQSAGPGHQDGRDGDGGSSETHQPGGAAGHPSGPRAAAGEDLQWPDTPAPPDWPEAGGHGGAGPGGGRGRGRGRPPEGRHQPAGDEAGPAGQSDHGASLHPPVSAGRAGHPHRYPGPSPGQDRDRPVSDTEGRASGAHSYCRHHRSAN